MSRRVSSVFVIAALLVGCGSSHGTGGASDGATDGSLTGEAGRVTHDGGRGDGARPVSDGGSTKEGGKVDAPSGDGGTPRDGGDAAISPCAMGGDRGYAPDEPYPDTVLIQNGGRIYNVMSPPTSAQHAAVGDGVTDDTAALQDAWDYLRNAYLDAGANNAHDYITANYYVYLPAGTYLVSDTIIYRGATLETEAGNYVWNDVVRVRFYGESRESTTIRLKDSAAGFGDATTPKIVLALQHPDTAFNNIVGENSVRNLTIDVGHGNPGAVGLFFQGANSTSMRDMTIRSDDGQGAYGLWFKIGSVQGYYRDISITGFDYGIRVSSNPETNPSLEHVTLTAQNQAAISSVAGGLSVREVCSDQRTTGAAGVSVAGSGAQVVVIDSTFLGGGRGSAMTMTTTTEESMFVRDVTTHGYDASIYRGDATAVSAPTVTEWVALPTVTMFDGGVAHSLNLPVEDTPIFDWYDPTSDWADVDAFGAVGDGVTDDSVAVQNAMNSGKPVVVFPKRQYLLTKTVTIPPTVVRIDEMASALVSSAGGVIGYGSNLAVADGGAAPLLIEHVDGYSRLTLPVVRPLALEEYSGAFLDKTTMPTTVFMENSANIGANDASFPANQTTWARSLNDEETSATDFIVASGTLWVFDYKTENKPVTSILAENGATVEVINGYVNTTSKTPIDAAVPMIENSASRVSFIGFTSINGNNWGTVIKEVHASGSETVPFAALPQRGYGNNVFIPLYSGNATP